MTVWASAGCGKTTFCTRLAAQLVEDGVCSKEQILYSTFQKTAAIHAAEVSGVSGDEYRELWFRTLHSVCFKLLRVHKGTIVNPQKMREFGAQIGVEINGDLAIEDDEAADLSRVILGIQRLKSASDDSGTAISRS